MLTVGVVFGVSNPLELALEVDGVVRKRIGHIQMERHRSMKVESLAHNIHNLQQADKKVRMVPPGQSRKYIRCREESHCRGKTSDSREPEMVCTILSAQWSHRDRPDGVEVVMR